MCVCVCTQEERANASSKTRPSEAKILLRHPPREASSFFPELYLRVEWDPQGENFSQKLGYFLRLSWDAVGPRDGIRPPLASIRIFTHVCVT